MEVFIKLFIRLQAARNANLEHINLHRNIVFKIESVCTSVSCELCVLKDPPQTLTMKKRKCFYLK